MLRLDPLDADRKRQLSFRHSHVNHAVRRMTYIPDEFVRKRREIKPSSSFSVKSQVPSQTNNATPLGCPSNNFGSLFRIISKCLEHGIDGRKNHSMLFSKLTCSNKYRLLLGGNKNGTAER